MTRIEADFSKCAVTEKHDLNRSRASIREEKVATRNTIQLQAAYGRLQSTRASTTYVVRVILILGFNFRPKGVRSGVHRVLKGGFPELVNFYLETFCIIMINFVHMRIPRKSRPR